MAVDSAPTRIARPGPFTGGRGRPVTVTQRITTALEPILEGIALCDEVEAAAIRLQTIAATGSRVLLVAEAGQLGARATAARAELRRLAEAVEPRQ